MQLRCDMTIPAGYRRERILVRLRPNGDSLVLEQAKAIQEATHQLVGALGQPLLTHLSEHDPVVSGEIQRAGVWETAETWVLLALARPGMTFVDAGANLGYYSTLLSRSLGPAGRVFAFEPEPRNQQLLNANVLLNRRLDSSAALVEVRDEAVSDSVGTAWLNLFDHNLGAHSLVCGGPEAIRAVPVSTTTLDSLRFPPSGALAAPIDRPIDVIKADIQGSEAALLRGAERTLERDRPILCLEFEPAVSGEEACVGMVRWLCNHGYQSFRLFHALLADSYQALLELSTVLSADGVIGQVNRKLVGRYGTLLAISDEQAADVAADSVISVRAVN
jgi:FkbM family methyltransferase